MGKDELDGEGFMGARLTTEFGTRDRRGALFYALRFAIAERMIYVLYFDYNKDVWTASPYCEFSRKSVAVCTEDIRYVLPGGEITKLV